MIIVLVANDHNGKRVSAWKAKKTSGPYLCPECNGEVVLKKGDIKIHHFAHKSDYQGGCSYGAGESDIHVMVKMTIYESLTRSKNCSKVEVERRLKGVRPDVSLYIRKTPVAVEVQRSNLSIFTIIDRMEAYSELGIYVLWVVPHFDFVLERGNEWHEFYGVPAEWQKFLHTMYFGRLYIWTSKDNVYPAHIQLSRSRRKRVLIPRANELLIPLSISSDFRPIMRSPWEGKRWDIPAGKIMVDKLQKWW